VIRVGSLISADSEVFDLAVSVVDFELRFGPLVPSCGDMLLIDADFSIVVVLHQNMGCL